MRQIKRIAVSLVLALGALLQLHAQNRAVDGTVLDASGQPVVGAVVMVPGTNNAAVTDVDGHFSIRVGAGEASLEVSCLGYTTQTLNVPAAQGSVSVVLQEDNMMLEETVVVGYGVQKKVNLTGAVTSVDTKELQDRSTHSLTNMLQGAVPGLNISTSSGNPGSVGSLNIRGITSINEAEPLVLIDGSEGDLSRVNAADVENISVIKDASAAAIMVPARLTVLSWSLPKPEPSRVEEPRCAIPAAGDGKSPPSLPTSKTVVTGRYIPWTSSGQRMPVKTTPPTTRTTWPNYWPV